MRKPAPLPSSFTQPLTGNGEYAREFYTFLKGILDAVISLQGGASVKTSTVTPTVSDIADGDSQIWKNTTSGQLRLYVNDGGVLKSTLLS